MNLFNSLLMHSLTRFALLLGVLSILDAATNNLVLLINTLNLQATLATPDITPIWPSLLPAKATGAINYDGSPRKKTLLANSPLKNTLWSSMSSISSLRPYAQSRGTIKLKTSQQPMSSIINYSQRFCGANNESRWDNNDRG